MSSKPWRTEQAAVLGASCMLAVTPSLARAAPREAKMYAITRWDGGCGGATRDWWDGRHEPLILAVFEASTN